MSSSKLYEVAIGLIPGIGGGLSKLLVSYCGSAERVFSTPKGKLKKIPGIGEKLATTISEHRHLIQEAEKHLIQAEDTNTKILFYTDSDYPGRLKNINDAPSLLYFQGNASLNAEKTVGIVGTRNASAYGRDIVEKIIEELKPYKPQIISGLAYGIDITAHTAALHNEIETIGCMATGLDIIYPSTHTSYANKMKENGGILTEYPFGKKAEPSQFPARNRIIAGLCDVLIVVEAAAKGGALITAEMANDYNREVFAIPGNLGQKYSEGCNMLIRNLKAQIYTGIQSLEYAMNWNEIASEPKGNTFLPLMEKLDEDEIPVYNLLNNNETLLMDEISWKSNIPVSRLASILLSMEFKGVLKSLPGKRYKLA